MVRRSAAQAGVDTVGWRGLMLIGAGLTGIAATAHADGGAAVGSTSTLLMRIMYADAPKDMQDFDVITNAPPSKPFRAPGGPPAFFALEQAVDLPGLQRQGQQQRSGHTPSHTRVA